MKMKCNVCDSALMDHAISLPDYPLNSVYLTKEQAMEGNRYKPRDLSVYMCQNCRHVQAESSVRLNELYNDDYNYNTTNSGVQGRIAFFTSQLAGIENIRFNRVIDVGCYNLSLLKVVKQRIKANHYIGIDPAIPNESLKNEDNIICFKDYVDNIEIPHFDGNLPDLVISDQTFEHIPAIHFTLGKIVEKVSKNSIFAICVPSLEVLIEKFNFHNLIHEHVNYFSIHTLSKLCTLNKLSLKSYTLNYLTTCGFLFGIFIKNDSEKGPAPGSTPIDKDHFLKQYDLFKSLLDRTRQIIDELKGEKIYGFGASDITANLAYFMGSDLSFLDSILDDTPYKQARFYPFLKPEIKGQNGTEDFSRSNCLITSPQAARYIYGRISNLNFKKIINPIGLIS
jgi:uncharacterized protein YlaI